ncbi:hypothetical protein FB451DRAFT_659367 [Mycena latifolia]|nr:hypothetical protein FB451DRAFT_659367 [Mycena latifolia]
MTAHLCLVYVCLYVRSRSLRSVAQSDWLPGCIAVVPLYLDVKSYAIAAPGYRSNTRKRLHSAVSNTLYPTVLWPQEPAHQCKHALRIRVLIYSTVFWQAFVLNKNQIGKSKQFESLVWRYILIWFFASIYLRPSVASTSGSHPVNLCKPTPFAIRTQRICLPSARTSSSSFIAQQSAIYRCGLRVSSATKAPL